jgi:hypothetical protein
MNFANGIFTTGDIQFGTNVAAGRYIIRAQSPQYLIRRPGEFVQLTNGQTRTIAQATLVAGDLDGDNKLTPLDYNLIYGCYSVDTPARSCDANKKKLADLTDDGKVNQFDINLFIREYSVAKGD